MGIYGFVNIVRSLKISRAARQRKNRNGEGGRGKEVEGKTEKDK